MRQDKIRPVSVDILEIFSRGFPPYRYTERSCSPSNSSPYRLNRAQLNELLTGDFWRLQLLDNLDRLLKGLEEESLIFPAVLIGGGFVRRLHSDSVPTDVDGLVFYKVSGDPVNAIRALSSIRDAAKGLKLDIRFCPLDADPFVMIESIAFFSVLYSKREGSLLIENGLILYER